MGLFEQLWSQTVNGSIMDNFEWRSLLFNLSWGYLSYPWINALVENIEKDGLKRRDNRYPQGEYDALYQKKEIEKADES